MKTIREAAFLALIALAGSGCYAYAGPPRHTHGRVVVVHDRPRPQPVVVVHEHRPPPRVVVRERVVERRHHRRHHHHEHD